MNKSIGLDERNAAAGMIPRLALFNEAKDQLEVEMEDSELVVISSFPSEADAQIAKGVLDGAGIESMIRTDDAGGMYPGIGGADLVVRAEDVRQANEILGQPDQGAR